MTRIVRGLLVTALAGGATLSATPRGMRAERSGATGPPRAERARRGAPLDAARGALSLGRRAGVPADSVVRAERSGATGPPRAERARRGAGVPADSVQDPQAPVFRSGTELVEVYAIVQDGDGKFVSGLTADDFALIEDEQPHGIQLFYLVNGPARRLPRASAAAPEDMPRLEDQSAPRLFTIVFDGDHLTFNAFARVKQAAATFLEEHFRPGDIGGIVVNGAMARGRLTTDRRELLESLQNATPTLDAHSRFSVFQEWPRLESEFEALRIEAGDARHLQDAIQRNCDERPEECERPGVREQLENELQWNARRYLDEARIAANRLVQTLAVVTQGLGRMEGRKTVMLITEGFFVEDSRGVLAQIAARAARFGITIYPIDARGLARASTGGSDASQAGPRIRPGVFDTFEDGPFILAADTGGFVTHNTNQFEKAFEHVADDTSTYYVLGYTPTNPTLDGTFRKIDVRVKWKGMNVRARKGYLATPLPPRARRYSGSGGRK